MAGKDGPTVGNARINIHANADGINEEIVDEVEKAAPRVQKAGEEAGEGYGDGMGDGLDKSSRGRLRRTRENLSRGLKETLTRSGEESGESFVHRLTQTMDKAGDRIGKSLGESIANSLSEKLEESFGRMLDDMENKLVSGNQSSTPSPSQPQSKYGRPNRRTDDFYLWEAYEMDKAFNKKREKALIDSARAYDLMLRDAHKMNLAFDRKRTLMLNEAHRMNMEFNAGKRGTDGRYIRGGEKEKTLPDRLGSLFGRGSRNNFLNLIGGSVRLMAKSFMAIGKGATSLFSTFRSGFKEASEGATGLLRLLKGTGGGLGAVFGSLAKSGPGALAAIAIGAALVIPAVSILVTLMSSLLAIVTALAATIVSALVGALAVAGAGVFALGGAVGLLVAAFTSLNKEQKELLKTSFAPLRDEFKGLGQIIAQDMAPAFATWSANLQRALALAEPLARVMGGAFAEAGNILTRSFSGPGFQSFMTALSIHLPGIVMNLSNALGGFMNGLLGMFAAIMPQVSTFAAYLSRVASSFSRWANSAQGRNAITDFVDRAVQSLLSLWNFAKQLFGLLGDLFFSPQGQNAGNTMFDSLAATLQDFRDKVQEWAKDGSLQEWFDKGVEAAEAVGEAIKSLTEMLASLDSSTTFQLIVAQLKTVEVGADLAKNSLKFLGGGIPAVAGLVTNLGDRFAQLGGSTESAAKTSQSAWSRMSAAAAAGSYNAQRAINQMIYAMRTSDNFMRRWMGNAMNYYQGPTDYNDPNFMGPTPPGTGNNPAVDPNTDILKDIGSGIPKLGGSKGPKQWKNPYVKWANSLIKEDSLNQVREAVKNVNRTFAEAMKEAQKASGKKEVTSILNEMQKSLTDGGRDIVKAARDSLNSAARDLAGASNPAAAARALRAVRNAQKGLREARKTQAQIQKFAKQVAKQEITKDGRVAKLMKGLSVENATLADYAVARSKIAKKLEEANAELTEAVSMRDNYLTTVTDSLKSFASIMTTQGKMLDGVEQQATTSDMIENLQGRLAQIKKFQENLKLLAAQGLNNDAYKQLVDAGVEEGGAFAQALVDGGYGAIQELNDVTGKINKVSESLGLQVSQRLYQAGVYAAEGLVAGLESQAARLDSAAARLGNSIAAAIKRSLGIKSPSTVLRNMMNDVGDGAVLGLDDQHSKVGLAAQRFSDQIAVSPEVASWAARQGEPATAGDGVSRNTPINDIDLTIVTPTEDPHAVANEVINEVIGRL